MRFILFLIIFGVLKDICHGCEAGYYFDSIQCQRCSSNCSICSSVTSCTVCKVGKYGTDCSSLCSSNCHDNVCNIKSGMCLSCEKGYYHDINNLCVPCPDNCTTCSSDKYCFACKSGFRGVICNETCFNCQYDTGCDKNSGYCFVNCQEGLSGELCNIECDSKCKTCERLNEHECISCTDNENGKLCKKECLNRCLKRICNKSDGSGDLGEYTGNQTCVSYCTDSVCNITSKERPNSSTTTHTGVILGPVIGSVVIIVVCIILVRSFCKTFGDKKSSAPNSNGNSGEANTPLLPPTTVEEGNPKRPDEQSCDQTESCDDRLQQSKGAELSKPEISQKDESIAQKSSASNRPYQTILVEGDSTTRKYIAAFGQSEIPEEHFHELLRTLFLSDCDKVVILTSSQEVGEHELERWFRDGREQYDNDLIVDCELDQNFEKHRVSTLHIRMPSIKGRDVKLFHFFDWPNNGIPGNVKKFLDFHTDANDILTESQTAVFSSAVNNVATYIAFDMFKHKGRNVNAVALKRTLAYLEKLGLPANYEQVRQLAVSAEIFLEKTSDE